MAVTWEWGGKKCFIALSAFYLRIYSVEHIVKDSERGVQISFRLHEHITTSFVIPVIEHRMERNIAQCVHQEGLIRRPIAP